MFSPKRVSNLGRLTVQFLIPTCGGNGLTATDKVASVLGLIPTSSDTAAAAGRQMKQC